MKIILTAARVAAALATTALSSAVIATTGAPGQPLSPVEGVLQGVSQTTPQQVFGRLIEDVCPGSLTTGNTQDLNPGSDLKMRCDEMWANALLGNDLPGVTTGLQGTASEEDGAVASSEVDASSSGQANIQGRMASVRGGGGGGFSLTLNGLPANADGFPALGAGDNAGGSGWGGFLAGIYAYTDRDTTDLETGFKSDTWGATGGIDYSFSANALLGLAFTYNSMDADLASNSGKLDSDSWGIYGYGSYYPGANTYIDYTIGYSSSSFDQDRRISYTIQQVNVAPALAGVGPPIVLPGFSTINQTAISDTDSDEFSVSAMVGHDWQSGDLTIGPYFGIYYADVDIDGFSERMSDPTAAGSGLALYVDDQKYESLTTNLGAIATYLFQGPYGPIVPMLMFEYVHEYKNTNDALTGGLIDDPNGLKFALPTDPPDRNYFNIGAGFTATVSDTSYFYARYNGLLGYTDLDVHAVEFGFLLGF